MISWVVIKSLVHLWKEVRRMQQMIADLTAAVDAILAKLATLQANQITDADRAALQAQIDRLKSS